MKDPLGQPIPTYDTAAPRSYLRTELRDLYLYRDLLRSLVRRNVTARYKRSVLGVLWTLLDPLLTMLVMAAIFTALFADSIPAYPLFLLTGLVIWNFIAQSSEQSMGDLVYGGALMGQVYMPRSAFAVAAIATGLVNLVVSLVPLLLLVLIFSTPLTASLLFLPVAIAIASAFTLGIGLLMSAFAVFFADILNIHSILMRLLMFLSGVFYSIEMLPTWMQPFVAAVPTYHIVVIFRDPIYAGTLPPLSSIIYASLWSVVALAVGFWVFTRLSDDFAYQI